MCKFTNRLFVLVLLHFVTLAISKPAKMRSTADLLDLLYNDYLDYGYQVEELHYDQRQKGEENLKVRLDGFVIGLPARMPGLDDLSWAQLLADEYHTNALPKKNVMAGTENSLADTTTTQVVNIPAPKRDIESRQQVNDEVPSSARSKSYLLQLLQMLRHTQP